MVLVKITEDDAMFAHRSRLTDVAFCPVEQAIADACGKYTEIHGRFAYVGKKKPVRVQLPAEVSDYITRFDSTPCLLNGERVEFAEAIGFELPLSST